MSGVERPIGSHHPGREEATSVALPDHLHRGQAALREWLGARYGPIELVLLATLIVLPAAFVWHFASSSYFVWDDFVQFHAAHTTGAPLSWVFEPISGYLAPAYALTYVVIDWVAPLSFETALAGLVACHAVSAVLLQRILTLLFGRAWWTYALALAWALSPIYLPPFTWFAAGLHSVPAITATLASIHGYLCWRATGRRGWLAWSLVMVVVGLGFYVKALLIPLYLILMRLLLLDPAARLRDSLRSVLAEWRVWLAYGAVCAVFLIPYSLGDYARPDSDATAGEVLRFLRVFWVDGFAPMALGVRVPQFEQTEWHGFVVVAAQVIVIGLAAWSIRRRRTAWRAWFFLLVVVVINALMVIGRVSEWWPELIAYTVRYYTEIALMVPLVLAFAFAVPRLEAHRAAHQEAGFRLPTARAGAAALAALTVYVVLAWSTAEDLSAPDADTKEHAPAAERLTREGDSHPGLAAWLAAYTPTSSEHENQAAQSARYARAYIGNLRTDLAYARRAGRDISLVDHDVPEPVVARFNNIETFRTGVRYTLVSSVVPLLDDRVTFNQPGSLYVVQPDGHLQQTRFVPVAGGSSATELQRAGRLRLNDVRIEKRRDESCIVAVGIGGLEWKLQRARHERDWWLRARYRTDPVEPFGVETHAGDGWAYAGPALPAMGFPGTAFVHVGETRDAQPTSPGVRIGIPPLGRLCVSSLELGYFDPYPSSP